MEQIYTPKQDYKVLVRCFTFNQSKYIEDAINGFAMQKTDFPFVCLVMDDCSTDGEQEVIKSWMERECEMSKAEYIDLELSNVILVPHKTNVSCIFAIYLLKRNLWKEPELKTTLIAPWREHCEYEAICEGDDYWIAGDKLQKQVEVFKSNPNVGLVFTSHKVKNDNTGSERIVMPPRQYSQDLCWDIVSQKVMIGTCSVIVKITNYQAIMSRYKDDFDGFIGDTPLWFHLSRLFEAVGLTDVTCVYRKNDEGVTGAFNVNKRLFFLEKAKTLDLSLIRKYGGTETLYRRVNELFTTEIVILSIQSSNYDYALTLSKDVFKRKFIDLIINFVKISRVGKYKITGRIIRKIIKNIL